MKRLVIYDSQYGNTEKVALAIAKKISAKALRVTQVKTSDLENIDTLVAGSPTQGGRASLMLQKFLTRIPPGKLKGVKVAAFDTRFDESKVNFALKLLIRTIDYAAPKMTKLLIEKGGKQIAEPIGFFVTGKEGPLASGELERARNWIKSS